MNIFKKYSIILSKKLINILPKDELQEITTIVESLDSIRFKVKKNNFDFDREIAALNAAARSMRHKQVGQ